MSRLTSEAAGDQECRYQYDLCGNRLAKESGDDRERYSYNQKNQLVERENKSGSWRYLFDGQGNLLRETGPERELHYKYNARNQQSRILSENTCIQENLYDREDLRAGLVEQGKRSTFLFVGGEIAAELDHTGGASRYIRSYGAAALEMDGVYNGIHHDEQLSTGWITGADGKIENAYEYDSFGNLLRNRVEVPNRILYGGQQFDSELGQYYLRARYYNPVIGRFTQEDVYRGDGLNLYAYCANNPMTYYDPSGYVCQNNGQAEENAQKENVTANGRENSTNVTEETTTLYRSVGAEEYLDIMDTKQFNLSERGMQSKQFGFNAEETLKFADWDKKAVAVVEVEIPTATLNSIGDFTPVDPGIFKSGNVTIHSDVLDIFNQSVSVLMKNIRR